MELSVIEINVVEQAENDATVEQLQQLSDLQLSCVGGGIAELVGH